MLKNPGDSKHHEERRDEEQADGNADPDQKNELFLLLGGRGNANYVMKVPHDDEKSFHWRA